MEPNSLNGLGLRDIALDELDRRLAGSLFSQELRGRVADIDPRGTSCPSLFGNEGQFTVDTPHAANINKGTPGHIRPHQITKFGATAQRATAPHLPAPPEQVKAP